MQLTLFPEDLIHFSFNPHIHTIKLYAKSSLRKIIRPRLVKYFEDYSKTNTQESNTPIWNYRYNDSTISYSWDTAFNKHFTDTITIAGTTDELQQLCLDKIMQDIPTRCDKTGKLQLCTTKIEFAYDFHPANIDDLYDLHYNLTYGLNFIGAYRKIKGFKGTTFYYGTDGSIRPYEKYTDENGKTKIRTRDKGMIVYLRPKEGPHTYIRMEFLAYSKFIEKELPHHREWKTIIRPEEFKIFDYIDYYDGLNVSGLERLMGKRIPEPENKRSMKKKVAIHATISSILNRRYPDPFERNFEHNDPSTQLGDFRTSETLKRLNLQNRDKRFFSLAQKNDQIKKDFMEGCIKRNY